MNYYHDGRNEVGPFDHEKLAALFQAGLISEGTLVRANNEQTWQPYSTLKDSAISSGLLDPTKAQKQPIAERSKGADHSSSAINLSEPERGIVELGPPPPPSASRSPTKPDRASAPAVPNDPAYKYIPRAKPPLAPDRSQDNWNSAAQKNRVSASPEARSRDPAYKFVPGGTEEEKPKSGAQPAFTGQLNSSKGPIGWLLNPPTPWRRYAARILDTLVFGLIGGLIFGFGGVFALYSINPSAGDSFIRFLDSGAGPLINILITVAIASVVSGILIGATGTSLGKLIFGVKVLRPDGQSIGVGAGLRRDLDVMLRGIALGIPIVSLFTMWSGYKKLTENGATSWDDQKYAVWHRPSGAPQYLLNVAGLILILVMLSFATVLDQI